MVGALLFVLGMEDILGAEFSIVFDADGQEDKAQSSWNMGLVFCMLGCGCMTGPALVNVFTDAKKPYTMQRACLERMRQL